MKRLLKISFVLFIALAAISIVSFLFLYNERAEFILTNELKTEIAELSNKTSGLSNRIYKFFDVRHSNAITNNPTRAFYLQIMGETDQACACHYLAGFYVPTSKGLGYGLNKLIIARYLDENYGNKKCLDIYLNRFDFVNGQIGIINAAFYYFNKNLSELTDEELATLIVMVKNPSLYNPKLYPDRASNEAKTLLTKLKN